MVVIVMRANEIRNISTTDLEKMINDHKTELFNLRFQLATGQVENTARIRQIKKEIARMKTIIRERELQG